MAIYNTRVVHANAVTKSITYVRNLAAFSTTYSGWTGAAKTLYKFLVNDTPSPPSNIDVDVYKDGVFVTTITGTYSSSDPISWYGSCSYEGISISLAFPKNVAYNDYEEFWLYKYDVLGVGEAKYGAIELNEIKVTHAGGTTTVYNQITPKDWQYIDPQTNTPTGTYVYTASGSLTITAAITSYMNAYGDADSHNVGDLGYYYSSGIGTWFMYEVVLE